LINLPPKKSGECDDCHVALAQREDDKEETIRKRFNTFLEKTQPLIDYYKKKNILTEVNATDNAPETLGAVMAYLK
jgi:adenylate kinase